MSVTLAKMILCFLVGLLIGYWIRFFLSNERDPNGEIIFKYINEDEASVDLKLYENRLDKTLSSREVIFKVVKKG